MQLRTVRCSKVYNHQAAARSKLTSAWRAAAAEMFACMSAVTIAPLATCRSKNRLQIAVLTYKVLSTAQPSYLHSLLSCRINSSTIITMSLRSSSRPLLELPRTRTVYGSRAFSASAPKIWNNLPINIINADSKTSFRKRLKTFLFTAAYAN